MVQTDSKKNLSESELIDLGVLLTQKAAFASFHHVGGGDEKAADEAAVSSMRQVFQKSPIQGTIVIGEGERDKAPMLFIGEKVGTGEGPALDIAVDPLEGTGLCARGEGGALSVLALADPNSLLHAPDVYMDKLACGAQLKGRLKLEDLPAKNVQTLSEVLSKAPSKLKIAVLKRERHQVLIQNLREAGCEPILFGDGDVAVSILTALKDHKDSIDLLLGSGGAPEGVLSALALKSLGGDFQGQLLWKNEEQKKRAQSMGLKDLNQVFRRDDLARGGGLFFASGVTSGPLAKGVQKNGDQIRIETFILSTKMKQPKVIQKEYSIKDIAK